MDEPLSSQAAVPSERAPRRFWALFFALLWPSGSGHLVIGRHRRAWAWASAVAGFLLVAELATIASGNGRFVLAGIAGVVALHVLSAIDVARVERSQPLPRVPTFLANLFLLCVALSGFAFALRMTLVESFQVPSASMFPTLHVGDHFFVNKRDRHYRRGDVALLLYPLDRSVSYVKRVIGVPGDVVQQHLGDLTINGQPVQRRELEEPCTYPSGGGCKLVEESFDGRSWRVAENVGPSRDFEAVKVPPRKFFVLGDNRSNSSDSRVWGFVDQEDMRGKPLSIWMSRENETFDTSRVNLPVR